MRGLALGLVLLLAGCPRLTPAEEASIARDTVSIAVCQAVTADCKAKALKADAGVSQCWDVYDGCMSAHGLTDGGI